MLIERSRDPEPVCARARAEFRNRKLAKLACCNTLAKARGGTYDSLNRCRRSLESVRAAESAHSLCSLAYSRSLCTDSRCHHCTQRLHISNSQLGRAASRRGRRSPSRRSRTTLVEQQQSVEPHVAADEQQHEHDAQEHQQPDGPRLGSRLLRFQWKWLFHQTTRRPY